MPPPVSCSVLTAGPASQQLWETNSRCQSSTASPSKSQLWCIELFIVAVQRTWLTSSCSAQPILIASSAPLRPEQPRYRELGPSSEDGLSLSAVPTCGTVFLQLSENPVDSNSSFRRALKTHLFQLSLRLTINCFYFLFYHFWLCNARSAGFYLVWLGTITLYHIIYHIIGDCSPSRSKCCYKFSSDVYGTSR